MTTPTVPLLYQFSVSPPSVPFCPQTPDARMKLFSPTVCNIQIRFWTSNRNIVGIQVLSLSSSCSFYLAARMSFAKSMTNVNVTSFQGFLIRFQLYIFIFFFYKKDNITILVPLLCVALKYSMVSSACFSERHGCEGQSVCCVDRARPHNPALSINSLLRWKYDSALLTF